MNKLSKSMTAVGFGFCSLAGAVASTTVLAGYFYPISGETTSAAPCSYYTSSNVRAVSSGGSDITVQLTDTGPLGVKFRVKYESTGTTSSVAYIPPLNTTFVLAQNRAGGTLFRTQFTCVTSSTNPNTKRTFSGTMQY